MSNNTQNANYWFNSFIITIADGVVKSTRKHLETIFKGLMLCLNPLTFYSWIRAYGCQDKYQVCYYQLKQIGKRKKQLEKTQKTWTIKELAPYLRESLQIFIVGDDTQTNHPGPKIQGADWMKDSTPQATDSKKCRGHSMVVVTLLVKHPKWGMISFPLSFRLYISKGAMKKLPEEKQRPFMPKTKLLNIIVGSCLKELRQFNKPVILLIDGGYANTTVMTPMRKLGVEVITRYRKDAIFYDQDEEPRTGKRGRPRKPRREVYDMEQCAECEHHPWQTIQCKVYGKERPVKYKQFRVRSNISEGEEVLVIMSRWVPDNPLSKESKESKPSWVLLVSTNLSRTAQEVIEAYSNRFSIEETFKELKEVEGIGKPQVRNLESTEATFQLQLFAYVLVELWSWNQNDSILKEFRGLADDPNRRPSHADKRKLFRFQLLEKELLRISPDRLNPEKIKTLLKCLISMGI